MRDRAWTADDMDSRQVKRSRTRAWSIWVSGISASARIEQGSTTDTPIFEYASREINGEPGPAGRRTEVRAGAVIQRGD